MHVCRTIKGTGYYPAKMGNKISMGNIFFFVNSAEQLGFVNHMFLPSALAGIIPSVCWKESLPMAEPLNHLTCKISSQSVKWLCLWV